jgi:hypothetical protein
MRLLPLLALFFAGCSSLTGVKLPWNSRANEQARLNAATAPKPATREEEILHPDPTKEFDPRAANFGSGRSYSTGDARTTGFSGVKQARTKGFASREFATNAAWGSGTSYTTKDAPTKRSWFSGRTARTTEYATNGTRDADKAASTRALPGGDRTFAAKGRRQAALDKDGGAGIPLGGDRTSGESWTGNLKPLSVEDVKKLLNRN